MTSDRISRIQFPAYGMADRLLLDAIFAERRKSDNLLSQIELAESDHGGPIRSVGGQMPYDSPFQTHEAESSIPIAAIESMDFGAYTKMLNHMAEQFAESLGRMFFSEFSAIANHVGQAVDQRGKTLLEGLREGLMRYQYDFDDDGNLKQMNLYIGPGKEAEFAEALAVLEQDPELNARAIQQREEFLKSRPKRRLLSPC